MAVLLFSLVVPGLAIAQTEVLYNGIHLPEQWPPRYAEPQKAQDMPIPYLEQKPGVIPVNVGRQLPGSTKGIRYSDLIRNGKRQPKADSTLHPSVMGSGMTKKTGSSKCGTWQVQVFFTKETIRPFIPDMPNRKTASTGQNLYWIFGTKPIL